MKKMFVLTALAALALAGCQEKGADQADRQKVADQQMQYARAQPIPTFDWSLERDLVIQLYRARNEQVATHTVWRSNYGTIEGDCPSIGFGLPYDTSLTNPLKVSYASSYGVGVTEQAEPNGIFASKNSAATWVMCVLESGQTVPVYIESKVTVYPLAVQVNYETGRVAMNGAPTVTIQERGQ